MTIITPLVMIYLSTTSALWGEKVKNGKVQKEAILIRVNDPSLNRHIGKYQLPHIWNEVLMNSPKLRLK